MFPHFPIFYPQITPKIGVNNLGIFKLNAQNIKTCILSNYCTDSNQILHSDRDHQNTLHG